jgi:hypothetical protein
MVISSFDPYHRLWQGATPTERAGVIPTPWVMPLALDFCAILLGDEWHVPPPPPPQKCLFYNACLVIKKLLFIELNPKILCP